MFKSIYDIYDLINLNLYVFLIMLFKIFYSNLRKKLPSKTLLCFSCSLLVLLVLFLTGIERVKPRIGCQFIAALIQYSLLATFFWMSVEGWVLYHNFVKVFGGRKSQKKLIIQSSLFAWSKFLSRKFLFVYLCNALEANKGGIFKHLT